MPLLGFIPHSAPVIYIIIHIPQHSKNHVMMANLNLFLNVTLYPFGYNTETLKD